MVIVLHCKVSGTVSLSASSAFSLTKSGNTSNATQNPVEGGFVNIESNAAGDIKKITYDVNEALENGGSGLDGLRAIAPNANYVMNVPSSNGAISFSTNVSSGDLSSINKNNVNKALLTEIRVKHH